jgi:lipid-A-disaccharide synthase
LLLLSGSGIIANLFIMEQVNKKYRIFLSAAEHSADSHCASLIEALQQKQGNIEFFGVGGDKMAGAGCKLLEITVAEAAMTYKAFSKVGKYLRLINKIKRFFKDEKIDLVIVCDSPAFNFHVAKAAKKMGIKTLFYVAPQLWAWAAWRIGKLRRYCDKLCCILPFEENWFRERDIDATFVSNPLFDGLKTELIISSQPPPESPLCRVRARLK